MATQSQRPKQFPKMEKTISLATFEGSAVIRCMMPKFNHMYTKTDIRNIVQDFKNKHVGKNLNLMVCVYIPNIGFRSAQQFHITEPSIITPETYDFEICSQFLILVWEGPALSQGGNDEFNDCLQHAIAKGIDYYFASGAKEFKNPAMFKQKLHVGRYDKVPVDKLDSLEQMLRVNIHCQRDYTRISTSHYHRNVYLKLEKEHYTALPNPTR